MTPSPLAAAVRRRTLLEELAEEADRLLVESERLWGPTDGRNSLCQAEQLRLRIENGRDMRRRLKGTPEDMALATKIDEGLAQLQAVLKAAEADPEDRRRCEAWRQAFAAWVAADARYRAAVDDTNRGKQ